MNYLHNSTERSDISPPDQGGWQRSRRALITDATRQRRPRHFVRLIQLLMLIASGWMLCVSSVWAQGNRRVATEEQIKASIGRAQQLILRRIPTDMDPHAALGVIALVKSGIDPHHPEILAACDRLTRTANTSNYTPGVHHVYEAAVVLLALSNVNSKMYRSHIGAIAQYLIASQGQHGQWHYPYNDEGDTSISQYAMLGLWEASRVGVVVPKEVWDKSASWHIRTQQKDGGFAYHPNSMAGTPSLHSMTVAGIGSLRIARRYLYGEAKVQNVLIDEPLPVIASAPAKVAKKNRSGKRFGILEPVFRTDETDDDVVPDVQSARAEARNSNYVPQVTLAQIDSSVDRAVNWMTTNFTVEKPTGFPIYFLYGLERASSLAEIKTYGGRDWYQEGATHLVATQMDSGGWVEASGEVPATAFAVLFMVRATSKMIDPEVPRVEFGTGILVGGRGLPDDLKSSDLNDGKVKKHKKTPLEDLLAQLENPQIPLLEADQAEIVEQVVIGDRQKLIGQVDRLKRLAKHPEAEVRRTALWALGRSDDLRLAPLLIAGLKDTDIDVFIEARNALRCLSRQVEDFGQKEGPLDQASRDKEWLKWKEWYKAVRTYEERDHLVTPGD